MSYTDQYVRQVIIKKSISPVFNVGEKPLVQFKVEEKIYSALYILL